MLQRGHFGSSRQEECSDVGERSSLRFAVLMSTELKSGVAGRGNSRRRNPLWLKSANYRSTWSVNQQERVGAFLA